MTEQSSVTTPDISQFIVPPLSPHLSASSAASTNSSQQALASASASARQTAVTPTSEQLTLLMTHRQSDLFTDFTLTDLQTLAPLLTLHRATQTDWPSTDVVLLLLQGAISVKRSDEQIMIVDAPAFLTEIHPFTTLTLQSLPFQSLSDNDTSFICASIDLTQLQSLNSEFRLRMQNAMVYNQLKRAGLTDTSESSTIRLQASDSYTSLINATAASTATDTTNYNPSAQERNAYEAASIERLRKQIAALELKLKSEVARVAVEVKKRNDLLHREANVKTRLKTTEADMTELNAQMAVLQVSLTTMKSVEKKHEEMIVQLNKQLSESKSSIRDLSRQALSKSHELMLLKRQKDSVETMNREMVEKLKHDLQQCERERDSYHQRIEDMNQQLQQFSSSTSSHQAHITSLLIERQEATEHCQLLSAQLNDAQHVIMQLKNELNAKKDIISDYEASVSQQTAAYNELVKRYQADVKKLQRAQQRQLHSSSQYTSVIRVIALKRFITNWRAKRQLIRIYDTITKLLLERYHEKLNLFSSRARVDRQAAKQVRHYSQLISEKDAERQQFQSLRSSEISTQSLVQLIIDELTLLIGPIEEMSVALTDSQRALEAFFSRCCRLTSQLQQLQNQLKLSKQHNTQLKQVLQQRLKEEQQMNFNMLESQQERRYRERHQINHQTETKHNINSEHVNPSKHWNSLNPNSLQHSEQLDLADSDPQSSMEQLFTLRKRFGPKQQTLDSSSSKPTARRAKFDSPRPHTAQPPFNTTTTNTTLQHYQRNGPHRRSLPANKAVSVLPKQ